MVFVGKLLVISEPLQNLGLFWETKLTRMSFPLRRRKSLLIFEHISKNITIRSYLKRIWDDTNELHEVIAPRPNACTHDRNHMGAHVGLLSLYFMTTLSNAIDLLVVASVQVFWYINIKVRQGIWFHRSVIQTTSIAAFFPFVLVRSGSIIYTTMKHSYCIENFI